MMLYTAVDIVYRITGSFASDDAPSAPGRVRTRLAHLGTRAERLVRRVTAR